jgi:DNA-binding NarL/FixJ family response regulator
VFIISAVRLYREGLVQLLRDDARLEVVGEAAEVADALERLEALAEPPDAVLLDAPAPGGLQALGLLERARGAPRVVALNVPDGAVIEWAEAGAGGLLDPGVDTEEMAAAIETTARGGTICSARLAAVLLRQVSAPPTPLTAREREILGLIDQGLSNKEIAQALEIELPTVKNHVHNILTKLNARRRGQAAAMLRDDH